MTPVFQHAETPLETGITVIAASAGTGKTFTLAALVTRLVAELGIPIRRLLLTTYTVAATAELRDRIRARLLQACDAIQNGTDDEFLSRLIPTLPSTALERLQTAARDFDEACIHTIHGFCQRALRELAFETGAPFDPELITDATTLFNEVADDYWRHHIYPADPLVAASLSHTKLSPELLRKLLREVSGQSGATIIPDASSFEKARSELVAIHREFSTQWPGWRDLATRVLVKDNEWGNAGYYGEQLAHHLEALHVVSSEEATAAHFLAACGSFCHLTTENVRAKTKKACKTPVEHPLLELCDRFAQASQDLHDGCLAHFVAWARGELDTRKSERGILLFDDLLTRLHQSLKTPGSETVAALGSRYEAVLVDEFQDTDPIQAEIFLQVFGTAQHRLMLIGDPKQAIYAFRGADLYAYLGAVDKAARQYTLKQNQRSTIAMVSAVNELFERPAIPFLDKRIPFDPVDAAGRADKAPLLIEGKSRPPFHFWVWNSDKRISKSAANRALPEMMAQSVAGFLRSGATIGGKPAQPGDCAVLCRSNDQARDVAEEIARVGIPAVVLSNANIFASEEAADFRILLASLSNPGNEPLLRSALSIPALGHTMASLQAMHDNEWDDLRQRWHAHHERWIESGFIRMFRDFLREEGARPRLLALPDGERRLTNLQHLAELAHIAAESQHLGTTGLLHWLDEEMEAGANSTETELRLDRDDSAVRVITVHKSKGLEYPVVFCPYLWTHSGLRKNSVLRFHDDAGRMFFDLRNEPDPGNTQRAQDEQFAEDIRLLYVALTRARHECHVVWGPFGNGRKKELDPEVSALLHLLEPLKDKTTFTDLTTHAGNIPPKEFAKTIADLCESEPQWFTSQELPPPSVARFEATAKSDAPLKVRPIECAIDHTWRMMSYSALHAGMDDVLDRKAFDPSILQGIHAFPRGIQAGSCIHDVLEHVDFAEDAENTPEILEIKLRQHAMFSPENVTALKELLVEIRAALPASALTRGTSLRELEFHLPAGLLTPGLLEEYAGASLKFDPQRGVLTGIMDLVYEHEGRYYIVDWKSNWLGPTSDAYTQEAMNAAMLRHRHKLQRELYVFALHRQLQLRVPGYDPAAHLGGASYVFLRGLDSAKPGQGIVTVAPEPAVLAKMEKLFPKP